MSDSPYLNVDPQALIKASETVDEPKSVVRKALDSFNLTVSALPDKPWGKDEIGEMFEVQYEGYQEQDEDGDGIRGHRRVLASLTDLGDGLQNMSEKTRKMGEDYIANDEANMS
jgi:hypothetical protein